MFEEAVSLLSIWASMNSWLTPTVLFLLLNLMIGTIAVTTAFTSSHKHHHHHPDHHHHHHLTHSPSVLQRLRSLNFYSHLHSPQQHLHHQPPPPPVVDGFPLPPPTTTSPSVLQRLKSFNIYSYIHSSQQPPQLNDSYYNSNTHLSHQDDDDAAEEEVVDGFPLPPLPQQQKQPPPSVINYSYFYSNTDTDLSPEDEAADEGPTLDEVYSLIVQKGNSAAYGRQNSDTKPTAGEIPIPLPRKMKKSASDKSAFNHFEAVLEVDDNAAPEAVAVPEERETAAAKVAVGVDERADDFINKFRQQLKMQRMDSIVRYKETITRGSAE